MKIFGGVIAFYPRTNYTAPITITVPNASAGAVSYLRITSDGSYGFRSEVVYGILFKNSGVPYTYTMSEIYRIDVTPNEIKSVASISGDQITIEVTGAGGGKAVSYVHSSNLLF